MVRKYGLARFVITTRIMLDFATKPNGVARQGKPFIQGQRTILYEFGTPSQANAPFQLKETSFIEEK